MYLTLLECRRLQRNVIRSDPANWQLLPKLAGWQLPGSRARECGGLRAARLAQASCFTAGHRRAATDSGLPRRWGFSPELPAAAGFSPAAGSARERAGALPGLHGTPRAAAACKPGVIPTRGSKRPPAPHPPSHHHHHHRADAAAWASTRRGPGGAARTRVPRPAQPWRFLRGWGSRQAGAAWPGLAWPGRAALLSPRPRPRFTSARRGAGGWAGAAPGRLLSPPAPPRPAAA